MTTLNDFLLLTTYYEKTTALVRRDRVVLVRGCKRLDNDESYTSIETADGHTVNVRETPLQIASMLAESPSFDDVDEDDEDEDPDEDPNLLQCPACGGDDLTLTRATKTVGTFCCDSCGEVFEEKGCDYREYL